MSLESVLQQSVDDGVMPGVVVLAIDRHGKTLIKQAHGKRSMSEDAASMSLDTVFAIKSMTKLVTTICVLQLVERGLLTLDEDITPHIPVLARQKVLKGFDSATEAPLLEDREGGITMRQLLTHSSGVGTDLAQPLLARYRQEYGGSTALIGKVEERGDLPLLFQPGEGWAYGAGVTAAGRVVEVLSGMRLEEYMRENVFSPLGVEGGTFFPYADPGVEGRLASMTAVDKGMGRLVDVAHGLPGVQYADVEDCFGGEGLYADLSDFCEVLMSLLMNDGKLLRKETVEQMFEPHLPTAASRAALRDAFADTKWLPGDFEGPNEYDWGLAGLLVAGDGHEFRRKGCMLWIGAAYTFWFIDRAAGLCGVFGTQVLPPADAQVEKAIRAFQREAYRMANGGKSSL